MFLTSVTVPMFSIASLSVARCLRIVQHDSQSRLCLVSCCRAASSSSRRTDRGDGFRDRSSRIRSREKDPFGYALRQRLPRLEPLDSPNLIFEERYRRHSSVLYPKLELPRQEFDFFLVLDFEATCDKRVAPVPQEIIEFPVIKVDSKTMEPVSTFHQYVLPTVHPQLSPFCTRLTGIIQDMVDNQPSLETTLRLFHDWMEKEGLTHPDARFSFVTCGDWDLGEMLTQQAKHFRLPLPAYFNSWINVKHAFSEAVGHYPRNLKLMLESLDVEPTGRAHSGIDDCKNIVHIMQALAQRGHIFRTSGHTKEAIKAGMPQQRDYDQFESQRS